MTDIRVSVISAGAVATSLGTAAALSGQAVERVVRRNGYRLLTKVKAKASGRPGPNAPTGDYRRSIGLEVIEVPGQTSAVVGTNEPQGRRLELGFTGIDSLGRYYDQPAYAHFGPGLDEIEPGFLADMVRENDKALK